MALLTFLVLVLSVVLLVGTIALAPLRRRKNLPPGPVGHFLVGNLFDVPLPPEEWLGFASFGKLYGPLAYLRVLGQDIVVLNTMKAASDLLEKRGSIYSDRPRMVMIKEVVGFDWLPSLMPYGDRWRLHRRALHQHLSEPSAKKWWALHEDLNGQFLRKLVHAPDEWWHLTEWLAGANILRMTFGLEAAETNDPWIQLGIDAIEVFSKSAAFGRFAVDAFPMLKHVPMWLPGTKWKRDAQEWHGIQTRSRDLPFEHLLTKMNSGAARSCIATDLLDPQSGGSAFPEDVVKNVTGIMYIAGADTTIVTMRAFFHAMVLNPDAQRAAQAEIDCIIPSSRLPTLQDRRDLPFVDAVVREVMRMYPVTPLVPHRLMIDDEYNGMHLPKGSTIIVNTWAIQNDECVYPEPDVFMPERHLRDGKLDLTNDPRMSFFGYGRRICPGRYVADAQIWLLVATVLASFNVSPAMEDGQTVVPGKPTSSGIVRAVPRFPCQVTPRSGEKRALVLNGPNAGG
ncbi:cytochrome P450 [Exidia glandulosa HHB12029]|uniref:Cytochrome P450 n=1 Tax=Exidia glandulosa HHB12029 TaxID=1314781 RepID=A0A165Q3C2_EXIGL|nr:cytochrome P450 [Exidia glandulosa HHB12029]